MRYIKNRVTSLCVACPYDCYLCDSSSNCLSCNSVTDFRQFNATTKRCDPLPKYFNNFVTVALPCPQGCLICQTTYSCILCSPNYFKRTDNLCYSSCPSRFYAQIGTQICISCPFDCFTCDENHNCLTSSAQFDFRVLNGTRCSPM